MFAYTIILSVSATHSLLPLSVQHLPLQFHTASIINNMSYKAGIFAAITELKDRTGSSSIAIKKHMQANLPSDKKWTNGMYLKALKKAVADGELVQTKGSYKLSAAYKDKAK